MKKSDDGGSSNSAIAAFVSVASFAAEIGVNPRTIWRRIAESVITVHRFGGRTLIRRSDADAYIDGCRALAKLCVDGFRYESEAGLQNQKK